ncbi:MAG: hypothetical protein KF708_18025 [Pirellulales bacterium]|nr:hypothetical protein [Pirellulales bacterium]
MSDHAREMNPVEGEEASASPGGVRGLLAKLRIPLIIGVIVMIECLAAYLFLPSSAESAAVAAAASDFEPPASPEPAAPAHDAHGASHDDDHGGGHGSGHGGGHGGGHSSGHGGGHGTSQGPVVGEYVEVELGRFSVMAFHPSTTNSTLVIDFHLYGAVKHADEAEFTALFDANEKRFRDEVLTTIRSAELAELTDPGLGLIKRKFLATTNRLLGKPLLQAVVFSDFSFIEQ